MATGPSGRSWLQHCVRVLGSLRRRTPSLVTRDPGLPTVVKESRDNWAAWQDGVTRAPAQGQLPARASRRWPACRGPPPPRAPGRLVSRLPRRAPLGGRAAHIRGHAVGRPGPPEAPPWHAVGVPSPCPQVALLRGASGSPSPLPSSTQVRLFRATPRVGPQFTALTSLRVLFPNAVTF